MTVSELIELLSMFLPDKTVSIGEAGGQIDIAYDAIGVTYEDRNYVLIYHES